MAEELDVHVELLSAQTIGSYLHARGLIAVDEPFEARELGGGVSNVVIEVVAEARRFVLKQSLPKLRVPDDWFAKRERITTEATALTFLHARTPEEVPALLDHDPAAFTISIEGAPAAWRNLKYELLEGVAEPSILGRLGKLLGGWHADTWEDKEVLDRFGDYEAFDQLRVSPYHRPSHNGFRQLPGSCPRSPIGYWIHTFVSSMGTSRQKTSSSATADSGFSTTRLRTRGIRASTSRSCCRMFSLRLSIAQTDSLSSELPRARFVRPTRMP
jgi:hypothetical protein